MNVVAAIALALIYGLVLAVVVWVFTEFYEYHRPGATVMPVEEQQIIMSYRTRITNLAIVAGAAGCMVFWLIHGWP